MLAAERNDRSSRDCLSRTPSPLAILPNDVGIVVGLGRGHETSFDRPDLIGKKVGRRLAMGLPVTTLGWGSLFLGSERLRAEIRLSALAIHARDFQERERRY